MGHGFRIQNFPAADLLNGPQTSISYLNDTERPGKSVCMTLEDLAQYFAEVGIPLGENPVLVELEGDWEQTEDEDAAHGAHLIHPTRIITETPLDETPFFDLVNAILDGEEAA